MEPVTHTLLGVTAANAFFRRRWGPETAVLLAVASNLPDIDAVWHLTGRVDAIANRRTFGHSLFLLPLWCALLAWLWKPRPDRSYRQTLGLVALAAAGHLFFDLINSFGVVLLWPLSAWRPELATTFVIDPALTACLALPLLAWKAAPERLIAFSKAGVLAAFVYVGLCGGMRLRALDAFRDDRAAGNRRVEWDYLYPEPFGFHRWRGIEKDGPLWRTYLVNSWRKTVEFRKVLPDSLEHPAVQKARRTELGLKLEAFLTAPHWEVGPDGRARVYDLRFQSEVFDRGKPFQFEF